MAPAGRGKAFGCGAFCGGSLGSRGTRSSAGHSALCRSRRALLGISNGSAEAKRQNDYRHCTNEVSAKQIAANSHGLRFQNEFAFGEPAF